MIRTLAAGASARSMHALAMSDNTHRRVFSDTRRSGMSLNTEGAAEQPTLIQGALVLNSIITPAISK